MPLPIVPIGILWIIGAAAAIGGLGGILVFVLTKEGFGSILVAGGLVIAFLLIPYLPNRYSWVREFKKKLRKILDYEQ